MLNAEKIEQMVREVATANLPPQTVLSVFSEATTDSEGEEAIRITIVIAPEGAASITGNAALDTLVQIQRRFSQEGEERFPIIEYATEDELQNSGDPEP